MKINLTSQTHKRALGYAFVFGFLFLMAFIQPAPKMPYKKAGLTEQEAALHLLNRFTFGPKPGQVEEVAIVREAQEARHQRRAQALVQHRHALEQRDVLTRHVLEACERRFRGEGIHQIFAHLLLVACEPVHAHVEIFGQRRLQRVVVEEPAIDLRWSDGRDHGRSIRALEAVQVMDDHSLLALLPVAGHLAWQVATLDAEDPMNPLARFRSNRWAGALMAAACYVIGNAGA